MLLKKTPTQVLFLSEYYEIFKNSFFKAEIDYHFFCHFLTDIF